MPKSDRDLTISIPSSPMGLDMAGESGRAGSSMGDFGGGEHSQTP